MKKITLLAGHRGFEKPTREDELDMLYCQELQAIILGYADKYVSYIVPSFGHYSQNEAIMKEVYHANDNLADLLISIHCNWSNVNTNAKGFNIFYNQIDTAKDKELAKKSKRFAEMVSGQLITSGFSFWGKQAINEDHLAGCGNLAVCSYSKMPAILIEIGFLSNQGEANDLENPATRLRFCQSIMRGITNYYV